MCSHGADEGDGPAEGELPGSVHRTQVPTLVLQSPAQVCLSQLQTLVPCSCSHTNAHWGSPAEAERSQKSSQQWLLLYCGGGSDYGPEEGLLSCWGGDSSSCASLSTCRLVGSTGLWSHRGGAALVMLLGACLLLPVT